MKELIPDTFWTVQEELTLFGGACLLGIPAGLLLDIARLLRKTIPHHALTVMIEDMLWMVSVSVLLLCYASGFAKGVFRVYYAVGCLLGLIVYECTLGQPMFRLCCKVLLDPLTRGISGFVRICKKVNVKFVQIIRKMQKPQLFVQNDLQDGHKKVYNKNSIKKKVKPYGKKSEKTGKSFPCRTPAAAAGSGGFLHPVLRHQHHSGTEQHRRKAQGTGRSGRQHRIPQRRE